MTEATDLELQVRRLDLRDGDVIVIASPRRLNFETRDRLIAEAERLRDWFKADFKVVVLDGGLQLTVVGRAELEAMINVPDCNDPDGLS